MAGTTDERCSREKIAIKVSVQKSIPRKRRGASRHVEGKLYEGERRRRGFDVIVEEDVEDEDEEEKEEEA